MTFNYSITTIISRLGSSPHTLWYVFRTHYVHMYLYDRIPVHSELANLVRLEIALASNRIMHSVLSFSNGSYQTLTFLTCIPERRKETYFGEGSR